MPELMQFAYADPPYMGQQAKHYAHDGRGEVDHRLLLAGLEEEFPDGWALSLSTPSLQPILGYLSEMGLESMKGDFRVGCWVKPFCSFKPGVNPAYAWEPVIWRGGRKRGRDKPTVRDFISANITLRKGLAGAKPPAFCAWLFDVLGSQPGDDLSDLFPGTGGVTKAWQARQVA